MTAENEYEREGAGPMPVQSAEAAGLEGIDGQDKDIDPEIAAEVQLAEETRETEAEYGDEEDAVEDPGAEGAEDADGGDAEESEGDD